MRPRLVRSQTDRVIAGVCGGLGPYLGLETAWVRIFFVLLALANGIGILLYILLWIILPTAEMAGMSREQVIQSNAEDLARRAASLGQDVGQSLSGQASRSQGALVIGLSLILLGLYFMARNLGLLWWLRGDILWPLALIIFGLAFLLREVRGR